jgi:hypothetical protein
MVPCQKGKWEPCGDRSDRRACEHSARLREPRRFWLPETFLWQAGKLPFDARCYFLVDLFQERLNDRIAVLWSKFVVYCGGSADVVRGAAVSWSCPQNSGVQGAVPSSSSWSFLS